MQRSKFRQIIRGYLLPFFPGAELERRAENSVIGHQLTSRKGPCRIAVKPNRNALYRLIVSRSQPFAADMDAAVTEFKVINSFVEVLQELPLAGNESLEPDLLAAAIRRVVTKSICTHRSQEKAVLAALDQLTAWATRLYEGRPISAAIGFGARLAIGAPKIAFSNICDEDFCAVLSNGNDTMLVCDYKGIVKSYEALPRPRNAPSYAPFRLSAIASWAKNGRLAMALNRSGEILLFRDQELIFVRRRGRWSFLAHKPAISQMRTPQDKKLRQAIYESALDASFARSGACLGMVTSANLAKRWRGIATKSGDYLNPPKSPKAQALVRMIKNRPFGSLDRRLRQELLAIDGATLVDHRGNVLTVGAILKIKGGSSGGGRLAAAQELSKLGIGIKVSQDGPIRGYRGINSNRAKEPCLLVM